MHLNWARIRKMRVWLIIAILLFPAIITMTVPSHAVQFAMTYGLSYAGVPFAGGAIFLESNFTNTGQLTIRVTEIAFASDFWANGTRQLTSGLPFNLTKGASSMVPTPILIPASASIGDHTVTGTASWQFSNSSGWYSASPISTSTTVKVSETISSLFSSLVTGLLIALGVAAAMVVIVISLVVVRKRRRKGPLEGTAPTEPKHCECARALLSAQFRSQAPKFESHVFFRKTL